MLQKIINKVISLMRPALKYLDNPLVMGTISLFIVLYGALARPALPKFIKSCMQNDAFRILFVFLIAYTGDKNFVVSITLAFAFMVLFGLLADVEANETFENTGLSNELESQLDKLLQDLDAATDGSAEAQQDMDSGMNTEGEM